MVVPPVMVPLMVPLIVPRIALRMALMMTVLMTQRVTLRPRTAGQGVTPMAPPMTLLMPKLAARVQPRPMLGWIPQKARPKT